MSFLERLASLYAPDDCLGCNREGSLLCAACLTALVPPKGVCFGCKRSINGAVCDDCLAASGLSGICCAANYIADAKLLVASLKFRGNQSAARLMAAVLVRHVPADGLLVNIPATTAHIRQRGFDQSALIAHELSRVSGLPYRNALRRSGQQHQLDAGREERLHQLSHSLSAQPAAVRGRRVILIDDVLTTGASLQAAAKALYKVGVSQVSALVFAQSVK